MSIKRFNDFNTYLKSMFGHRVHKVSIDAGLSCPNRNNLVNNEKCIFCNKEGSGNNLSKNGRTIISQIQYGIKKNMKRYNAKKFIAYFQSFSNTYATMEELEKLWSKALSVKNVIGLSIGTRPDCINNEKLELLERYTQKYLIWIEYGLQSSNNKSLEIINRGHSINSFIKAISLTKKKKIKVCAHVILGLPNESITSILKTADFLNKNNIDAVKIHFLYIIKNTMLEKIYKKKYFKCLKQIEYASIVCRFLERLSSKIIIQRISSDPNPKDLIAPLWGIKKKETLSLIHYLMEYNNTWQGKKISKYS